MPAPSRNMPGEGRGRSALSNPAGRFEAIHREPFREDRGTNEPGPWEDPFGDVRSSPKTQLRSERSRSVLTRNASPDILFDQSLNPYRGCEHGCIYCYARPSHGYIGLSSGLDFETRIFHKENAPEVLTRELRSPRYQPRLTVIGANTDAYQPAEKRLLLTRRLLEVFFEYRHPVSIITKSALIVRDIDILSRMARENLVAVAVSLTTLRADIAASMEPRAAAPHRRLDAIRALSSAGIPVQPWWRP